MQRRPSPARRAALTFLVFWLVALIVGVALLARYCHEPHHDPQPVPPTSTVAPATPTPPSTPVATPSTTPVPTATAVATASPAPSPTSTPRPSPTTLPNGGSGGYIR